MFRDLLDLIFDRERLVESACAELEAARSGHLANHFQDREKFRQQVTDPDRINERAKVAELMEPLKGALYGLSAAIIVALLLGLLARFYFGILPKTSAVLQYLGTFVMIFATLAKAGWPIQTFEGTTLIERMNEFIYRALYMIGTFFLAAGAAMGWQI